MASVVVLILLAWLVVAVGPARAAATLISQGKAATRVVGGERRHAGERGGRRQHRYPVVERL